MKKNSVQSVETTDYHGLTVVITRMVALKMAAEQATKSLRALSEVLPTVLQYDEQAYKDVLDKLEGEIAETDTLVDAWINGETYVENDNDSGGNSPGTGEHDPDGLRDGDGPERERPGEDGD